MNQEPVSTKVSRNIPDSAINTVSKVLIQVQVQV